MASMVTVAACPTFTLLMSDSLNATVMVIESVLTISANGDEPLPAPDVRTRTSHPSEPAVFCPSAGAPELPEDVLLRRGRAAEPVDPAEIESPADDVGQ